MSIAELPKLLTEAEAYELYGHVLQDKELRRARQSRIIGYYMRCGKVLYRADELAAFIAARLQRSYVAPCQTNSGSADIGSIPSADQPTTIAHGMTPDLVKSAADHLRQQISKTPRSSSPRSSSPKAKLLLVTQDK